MVRKLERRKQTIVIDEQLINEGNEKKTNIKLNLIAAHKYTTPESAGARVQYWL